MAAATHKVAVITGGACGMGLAVAEVLSSRGGWEIHILDIKEKEGKQTAASLPSTIFHKTDLTKYDEIGAAFKTAFLSHNRLDFVHANAGKLERSNMYELTSDSVEVPPEPDFLSMDINLRACINTVHIARHYISRSPEKGSIVITASCSSIWSAPSSPIYSAAKHGAIGFMRSIAGQYMLVDKIRVNMLCPGVVRTSLIPEHAWAAFPPETFTPMELITRVVLSMAAGEEIADAKGVTIPADKMYGRAIVANGNNFYFNEQHEYCDEIMARTVEAARVENQRDITFDEAERRRRSSAPSPEPCPRPPIPPPKKHKDTTKQMSVSSNRNVSADNPHTVIVEPSNP